MKNLNKALAATAMAGALALAASPIAGAANPGDQVTGTVPSTCVSGAGTQMINVFNDGNLLSAFGKVTVNGTTATITFNLPEGIPAGTYSYSAQAGAGLNTSEECTNSVTVGNGGSDDGEQNPQPQEPVDPQTPVQQEEQQEQTPVQQEEQQEQTPVQQEEQQEQTPVQQEEQQEQTPVQQEEQQEQTPVQQEEQQEQTPVQQEEQQEQTPVQQEEQQEQTPVQQEEQQEQTPVQQEEQQEQTPVKKGCENSGAICGSSIFGGFFKAIFSALSSCLWFLK